MYSSQQNLITVRLNRELNQILLYKTLGGGWTADGSSVAAESAASAENVEDK